MRVLGVFAKQPVAGTVKTRLARGTSPQWAAEVAAALLADTLERVAAVAARRVIAFAPTQAGAWFATAARGRFELQPQADGDLGPRLSAFFASHATAPAVVVLGTDSPTVPVAFIEEAFTQLQTADLVVGPTGDGGYYLIGCGQRRPPVFDDISWGTPAVLRETVQRLADPSWRLALLPPWYDVDTLADWQALCGHVAAMRRAGTDPGVPHLEALM